jgi:uncharacterized membrane protein YhfC
MRTHIVKSVLIALMVVFSALGLRSDVRADLGLLTIKCDGTSAEMRFISHQRGTEIRNGMRVITSAGGYIVYRIPVGTCAPRRVYYALNVTAYALEFSPDGRKWSWLVRMRPNEENPREINHSAAGFVRSLSKSAAKSGTAFLRFRRSPGGQAPLVIQAVNIEVSGDPLPKDFRKLDKSFNDSWFPLALMGRVSVAGALMVLLGIFAVLFCRYVWRTPTRLFGLGALLWTIAVAVKVAIALPLNKPIGAILHHALHKPAGDVAFWIYIGLLTGITEVGIFLAMAGWFQRRRWSWKDAASVGVGFGAIESILLGLALIIPVAVGKVADPGTLVPVIERFLTIFIHTAATVMAIYGVTTQRWAWFWASFVYKSALDALAAFFLLSGHHLLTAHPWFVELGCFGPFAYAAIPILLILRSRWPAGEVPSEH